MHPLRRLTRPARGTVAGLIDLARTDLNTAASIHDPRPGYERPGVAGSLANAIVSTYRALDALGGDTRAALDAAVERQGGRRPGRGRADRDPGRPDIIVAVDSPEWRSRRAPFAYGPNGHLFIRAGDRVLVLGGRQPVPDAFGDGPHDAPGPDTERPGREPGGIAVTDDTHRPPDVPEAPQALRRITHQHERWQIRDDGDGNYYCGACGLDVPAPGTVGCG